MSQAEMAYVIVDWNPEEMAWKVIYHSHDLDSIERMYKFFTEKGFPKCKLMVRIDKQHEDNQKKAVINFLSAFLGAKKND